MMIPLTLLRRLADAALTRTRGDDGNSELLTVITMGTFGVLLIMAIWALVQNLSMEVVQDMFERIKGGI